MTGPGVGPLVDPDDVPEWLRALVKRTADLDGGRLGWPRTDPPADARPAAVLVLFGEGVSGPDVLLLRRADSLNSHPGQVAFPGGALDPGDDGPVGAALREAAEEVGVLSGGVRPVAVLPELHVAHSGFRVTPVLAHWRTPSPVAPVDPAETAAVARVPVSWLTDSANRIRVRYAERQLGPAFLVPGMLVWGFTGGLLAGVLDLAGWARGWNRDDVRELGAAWRAAEEADDVGFGTH
ncbi:CoA pyrophosphatase [Saccharopolyspora erythraea]|uniref:NUDIX hydrolase n=1 Tax=Saccharopolyspora erythraea TaxID=1836 RepID=UPI001BA5CCCF|nr:CoA pyrophosphatase [Saccharopolyspora erythraea]QUG99688.1 CoA pyrophosphatase [Saccharopolyspora erythraea]